MADQTDTEVTLDLPSFLSSVKLSSEVESPIPMLTNHMNDLAEDVSEEDRFLSSLATIVYNMDEGGVRFDKQRIADLVNQVDVLIEDQLNEVYHAEAFQEVESVWRGIEDLCNNVNFKADISLGLLDVSKEEAFEDLEMNAADIAGSEFFKKIYVSEYDQYGGAPWGSVLGLYDFNNTPKDLLWLKAMGKVATASHAPFVGSVSPKFFGCETMAEVNNLRDIEGMLDTPKYAGWNQLRETEQAAYIGLTMPRYLARRPYSDETNPAEGVSFEERVGNEDSDYLWAPASLLMGRNLAKSFETSGWCQHIRGPKAGGLVAGLPSHKFEFRGETQLKLPCEVTMPDYRELELANSGLIPLIQKKGSSDAVFFSVQSIKKSHNFKDPKDSENSQLVSNLSYTFSISRIAHYLKCIMRDNIGSTADAPYIYNQIDHWISKYITTVVNPDDLTLRYYPFKAYSLEVNEVPGRVGWYHCNLSILPHIQFEGMDVDLRVDARLG
ncbi:MAG: type VI secretion system contractile sheath large subunit [Myxococcota bacterium]|nr:type VI secretion system contractile sheath large subunit [Myxococcota bacterium]